MHFVDRAEVVQLAAGCRIERRLIENDTEVVADGFRLNNGRVEFQKIGVVVIESLGLHGFVRKHRGTKAQFQFTVCGGAGTW